jgi:hypothetical protein
MVLVARSRDLDMKDVLQYSLRPFPLPLAFVEGNVVKTAKSNWLNTIESETQDAFVESVDGESALIVDAMAILQTMKVTSSTFGELAYDLLMKIINMATRIDFVRYRYPGHSIKNLEREKRSEAGSFLVNIYGEQQRVPRQWKKFLSNVKNK